MKKGISKQMLDLYEPEQLEKKFGGVSENLTSFWPPVFPIKIKENETIKDSTNSEHKYYNKEEEFKDEGFVQTKKKKKNKKKRKRDDDDIDKSVFSSSLEVIKSEHDDDYVENDGEVYLNVFKKLEALEEIEENLKANEVEIEIKSEMDEKEIVKREKLERKKKRKERKEKKEKKEKNEKKGKKVEKIEAESEDKHEEKIIGETSLLDANNGECSQMVPIIENESKTVMCGCNSGCLIF